MDRRTLLALLLTAIVIVATPKIFPTSRREIPVQDTLAVVATDTARSTAPLPATAAPSRTIGAAPPPSTTAPRSVAAETTTVRTEHAIYGIVSPGGTPASVTLPDHRSLRPGAQPDDRVSLFEPGERLVSLRFAGASDTISLDTVAFRAEPQRTDGGAIIQRLTSTNAAVPIALTYRFVTDSFVVDLSGSVGGSTPRTLLVQLPSRIRSDEADVLDDTRHLAFAYRLAGNEVHSIKYGDLDSLVTRVDTGGIRWVSQRNKYFVLAAIPRAPDSTFRALITRGGVRTTNEATSASAVAVLPLRDGTFAMRLFAGPQAWDHLRVTAPQLENVNPYGGWLHNLVQPFATIVMRLLLWMRDTFDVGYGWVLVIFGVAVRLLLWPLNQNAMRSSLKMQRLQPELAEIQKKFRDSPEKQRDAIMKLYADHGMSPFSPLLGCLPMLLPMPILFALYFVFQNTIELRGVSFFWLPDLSLRDPLFITPLFMGISMFLLSWIGMRGVPPTPQSKMMAYAMPVMFTVLFWNFASGLNLYYAVQNVAALPQQWLLSRERVKTAAPTKPTAVAAKRTSLPGKKGG
ncbi:MAG TPA: membrane protein insertase YidC [Gemmatimonadaceae bacterium]|nr:membrane protein insertase YidC [Gemmatimonadaceae bacterium]